MKPILNILGEPLKQVVRNGQGEPILLNELEQKVANHLQRQMVDNPLTNAIGYEVDITTLTTVMKRVSEQKFFEIAPADYMPVRVGEGAWSSQLLTFRSFQLGGDFESGIVNTAVDNARLAQADAAVDSLPILVFNWAKTIGWNIMDIAQAAKAGNWDLVSAKEKARKTNWDLGIQRIAFLGSPTNSNILGLYTQAGVTNNTSRITKAISSMTTTELKTFCAGVLDDYRANAQRTAWPTHFIIPESDYLGLASPASADFPIRSTLDLLLETFRVMTKNPNFQILPCAYGDSANHADINSIAGKQFYVMLNYSEESLRMDIPVDYTSTVANSLNNFAFQNVAYGQFTGVLAYRPQELLYFSYSA